MKIRMGFVSNSSSSSFVVHVEEGEADKKDKFGHVPIGEFEDDESLIAYIEEEKNETA